MNSEIAIQIRDVSKCYKIYDKPVDRLKQGIFRGHKQFYREFWALKDVSFDVRKGETIGIVGKNGSGKSTLLQMIAGTLTPTFGDIQVNGRVAALLELGSGFNPEFTGRENIYLNGTILGFSREQMDSLYEEIVAFADIGDFIDQPIKTYSSGMTVRLAFAVQAMVPKEILIVDEALAVGDELFQRKCYAKLEEFKQQGGTILFVSHSGSTVVQLCDRALLLDGGEQLLLGPSKTVVNLYQKFVHAPADKKAGLREELKAISPYSEDADANLAASLRATESVPMDSMFDPHFVYSGTVYESHGADIVHCEIRNAEGKKVNLLIPRERYTWSYTVEFTGDFQDVRFGMLIKTESGLELGGATSALEGKGVSIRKGTAVTVDYTFCANLMPGNYFLNCGIVDSTGMYVARAVDHYAFKVLHYTGMETRGTGIVDFLVQNRVEIQVQSGK
ncbi:ABC transporter ATP-binding protein [Cohnella candidum]|uniref:ABC transporter ATP-binding protein n=1 Tax=Cohnella candidum TaxID=2674991 RepID=A0A3G3K1B3_9BACL|nr:ABC transporter ATP-binding protein [Cohnella candidum]AYQ74170.1 ABC transporter ATP-binding protein [Cohnella candidum]